MKVPSRFSIAGLMAVVLAASLALAALRSGSEVWAGGLYLLMHAVLTLAIVGAVCRGSSERAWWAGFALFGLSYLRWVFRYGYAWVELPTMTLLSVFRPEGVPPIRDAGGVASGGPFGYYYVVGHCLWSLLFAAIGGGLAHVLFDAPAVRPADPGAGPGPQDRPARRAWRRWAALGLVCLVGMIALVRVGMRSDPALWAGAIYMLTWALLGVAALGFACGRGRRRMVWFGAALFGLGYMILDRGPDQFEQSSYPHLVADQFLVALRPWLPPVTTGFPAESAVVARENTRIKKALAATVPMTFPDPTPLEDVLRYVRAATRTADGREVVIYVDPVGLQEAEKSMQSTVQIDVEGTPLTVTLRLALKQLGLLYQVTDGLVYITCEASEDFAAPVDYYLLLGHCALAWLAAGLGAGLVPLVASPRQ